MTQFVEDQEVEVRFGASYLRIWHKAKIVNCSVPWVYEVEFQDGLFAVIDKKNIRNVISVETMVAHE